MSAPDGVQVDTDGVLTWTDVEYSTNDSVVISVSDGKVNSTFSPQVAICNCQNGGMLFLVYLINNDINIRFVISTVQHLTPCCVWTQQELVWPARMKPPGT